MPSHLIHELKRSKYRLLGLVGQGQFGRVFCASHRKTGRLFALKELDQQRFPTHKFLRELRFLLSLQHPNIVTCHALEHTHAGRRYLIMDYCEAGTLRSLMEDVCLNLHQGLKLVADVLAGLEHAHSRGIVHCDIKPDNILLNIQPTGWRARISDFGIARLSQELNSAADSMGSPAYMAPERFYNQYSHSSDLYAVGILLFELVAGHRPFSGSPPDLMSAHLNQPVQIPASIPDSLRPIILTALQKLPARRFTSAAAMLQAVQAATQQLLSEESVKAPLLQPTEALPVCSFANLRQEGLSVAVSHLAAIASSHPAGSHSPTISTEQVYQATGTYLSRQIYPAGILAAPTDQQWQIDLPDPVQELIVCPQGCFAVTSRAVYFIPQPPVLESFSLNFEQDFEQVASQPKPERVAHFSQDFLVAINGRGGWGATAVTNLQTSLSEVTIWQLPDWQSVQPPIACKVSSLSRLLILDSGHVAAVSGLLPPFSAEKLQDPFATYHAGYSHQGPYCSTNTLFEILTRRGDWLGSLSLAVPLSQLIASTVPYRYLALEFNEPQSALLIDLKPFRALRIGIEIVPTLMAATPWGYVLADAQGQIVLMDQDGQGIDRIDGPANPTAIAAFGAYGLLIATWDGDQGSLHTVDLRQLNISLMF